MPFFISDILTCLGVKKCLITFSRNSSDFVNFCDYEPILMKFSEITRDPPMFLEDFRHTGLSPPNWILRECLDGLTSDAPPPSSMDTTVYAHFTVLRQYRRQQ